MQHAATRISGHAVENGNRRWAWNEPEEVSAWPVSRPQFPVGTRGVSDLALIGIPRSFVESRSREAMREAARGDVEVLLVALYRTPRMPGSANRRSCGPLIFWTPIWGWCPTMGGVHVEQSCCRRSRGTGLLARPSFRLTQIPVPLLLDSCIRMSAVDSRAVAALSESAKPQPERSASDRRARSGKAAGLADTPRHQFVWWRKGGMRSQTVRPPGRVRSRRAELSMMATSGIDCAAAAHTGGRMPRKANAIPTTL